MTTRSGEDLLLFLLTMNDGDEKEEKEDDGDAHLIFTRESNSSRVTPECSISMRISLFPSRVLPEV